MGRWNHFYKAPGDTSMTQNTSGGGISLRDEFNNLFNGTDKETRIARWGLLRKMDRDSSGRPTNCPCVDTVTLEADRSRFCPICAGEKFYWTEIFVKFYRVYRGNPSIGEELEIGDLPTDTHTIYLQSDVQPTIIDKFIEIEHTEDGSIITPIRRIKKFRFAQVTSMNADFGRREFWVLKAEEERDRFLSQTVG